MKCLVTCAFFLCVGVQEACAVNLDRWACVNIKVYLHNQQYDTLPANQEFRVEFCEEGGRKCWMNRRTDLWFWGGTQIATEIVKKSLSAIREPRISSMNHVGEKRPDIPGRAERTDVKQFA
jgi:hypothetical protein